MQNQHVKNFLGFVISLVHSIAAESQWSPFNLVGEDVHTEYTVKEDWSYGSEVVLPSFVGDM